MNNINIVMPLNVETYDIDLAGHVNNIVYIKWLEELRTKLFNKICSLEKLISNNLYIVVVSTNINYKKQLKMFDKPIGMIELKNIRHGIITLSTIIKLGNKISAVAEQKCVVVDLGKSEMVCVKMIDGILLYNDEYNC